MGRDPFKEHWTSYLGMCVGTYADKTIEVTRRRFRGLERIVRTKYEEGELSTQNPKHFTAEDSLIIYTELGEENPETKKARQPVTVSKYMNDLRNLCLSLDNCCVDVMHKRYPYTRKKIKHTRLECMDVETMEKIAQRTANIDDDDFTMLRSYAVAGTYLGAGTRTLKLQHIKVCNVHLDHDIPHIFLEVVKGGDTYGEDRYAPMIPMFYPVLKRYMVARQKYLDDHGLESDLLFFRLSDGVMLTDKSVRKVRSIANTGMGMDFSGMDCRRSYGQYWKDLSVPIEDISRYMGHASTKTTERYCARIRPMYALKELKAFLPKCTKAFL
ncbi:tyrosine-type recombinase/integrase [Methanomethylophilus alvi]|uniref:tyrosine-type recombinase/integrase n=1 Tax=Methanomethylophilus alvi TaxID=1291540 RepID=UPI0037DD39A0